MHFSARHLHFLRKLCTRVTIVTPMLKGITFFFDNDAVPIGN
jgi:hypothetical protein